MERTGVSEGTGVRTLPVPSERKHDQRENHSGKSLMGCFRRDPSGTFANLFSLAVAGPFRVEVSIRMNGRPEDDEPLAHG